MSHLLAMFGAPGWVELLIIGGIMLLLFGNRLPSVMRSLGTGIVEFKKGVSGIDSEDTPAVGQNEGSTLGEKSEAKTEKAETAS